MSKLNSDQEQEQQVTFLLIVYTTIFFLDTGDRWMEFALKSIFESEILVYMHPRTRFKLNFQPISDDGSLESAAINSGCIALINAGVPLSTMICATTVIVTTNGDILVDPTAEELLNNAVSSHTIAFSKTNIDSSPVYINSKGKFTREKYQECESVSREACKKILKFLESTLESN
ncbi:hypothetical protein BB558_000712 [Smittium angustum]|uniref:Uncharacterized protein n=1 Tax=Smittium angustum TaxID=133377 RepID=A0A2U1JDE9_SMIAN|nr:hypothetical protein BB558_000712 [Smittium angustum]